MIFFYFILLTFCLVSIYPTAIPYRKYLKDKFLWTRMWTPHALIVSSIALFLLLIHQPSAVLNVLSGTLMGISGFGLLLIMLFHLIENRRLLFSPPMRSLVISVHHSGMGVIGLWFLASNTLTILEFLWLVGLLGVYALIIFPKGFDVPFILYKKSSISLVARRKVMQILTGIAFLVLPLLRLQ